MGLSYYNGDGVSQNYEEAAKWYEKAAEQGYVDAEYNLGLCYQTGRGALMDYAKAKEWFTKAAKKRMLESQKSPHKNVKGQWPRAGGSGLNK